jgi:hypothetical protein
MEIFVPVGNIVGKDIVSAIESTEHKVIWNTDRYYVIEANVGHVDNYKLFLEMDKHKVSFSVLTVENNKCRHVVFSDVNVGRSASFSAENGPMRGKKNFIPKFWINWMNDK